jgi:hypothetical protein
VLDQLRGAKLVRRYRSWLRAGGAAVPADQVP